VTKPINWISFGGKGEPPRVYVAIMHGHSIPQVFASVERMWEVEAAKRTLCFYRWPAANGILSVSGMMFMHARMPA